MSHCLRFRFARDFAAVHWAILVLIQLVNDFAYLLPKTGWGEPALRFLLALPLLQTENVLAAALVGVAAYLFAARPVGRVVFFAAYAALTAYTLLDQMFYKVAFDHYRLSMSEGVETLDPRLGLSSLGRAMDAPFSIVAVAAVAALAWLAWRHVLRAPRVNAPALRPWSWYRTRVVLPLGLVLLWGMPGAFSDAHHNLQHYPLTGLIQEAWQPAPIDLANVPPGPVPEGVAGPQPAVFHEPEAPRNGPPPQAKLAAGDPRPDAPVPAVDLRLEEAAAAVRRRGRPNVLLVVLESVGSRQLLNAEGCPSAADTPRLAELSRRAVVFDGLYSIFPGTVRTHVALNTGGRFLTWGSVYEMLPRPYEGPTLARTFGEQGYRTALFSSARLDGEAMDQFMEQVGYGTYYDFARDAASQVRGKEIHTWGAIEEYTLGKIERWLSAEAKGDKPFFLTYLTVATHHPYGVPQGYPSPHPDKDDFDRYRNSLHYTDAALGKLFDFLKQRHLDDNTIIAVTGDHGQAFGTWHPNNFTHKYHLYEENVRSFLLLAHPAINGGPLTSGRVGTSGDLLPTLASLAGLEPVDVPGKNLLAGEFPPRIVYFHKNAYPEKWGLRDGTWKFIQGLRDRHSELYDLSRDPTEQQDVAADHPERVARYAALCAAWFARENDEFAARLKGYHYPGSRPLRVDDWRAPGPKILTVGYRLPERDNRFVEQTVVPPGRAPLAWTRWVSDVINRTVEYRWEAPSGKQYAAPFTTTPDWTTTYVDYPGPLPMEAGEWRLTLARGDKVLLSTRFTVSEDAH